MRTFKHIVPLIQRGDKVIVNPKYTKAKFRGWLFTRSGKHYFQIRGVDDPPKGKIVYDCWPYKFRIALDKPRRLK